MAVLSSNQVAVYPFHLDTTATLDELAQQMVVDRFKPTKSSSVGWGSIDDDDTGIKLPPIVKIDAGRPSVLNASKAQVARLRARYYWLRSDSVARRREGISAGWQATTVLEAADVLLWDDPTGGYTGVVTDRPNHMKPINALVAVARAVDAKASFTVDTIPQRLDPDFFLWLMYRARSAPDLTPDVRLGGITHISSMDGRQRSVDVKDGATLDRIELAASIALGATNFGPAKFSIDTSNEGASFFIDLHPDGGFQPYKSSSYEDPNVMGHDFMLTMIEDLWMKTLPELRSIYASDTAWARDGITRFRAEARDEVWALLGFGSTR
ncbi:hypothetical protein [Pseudolysinimonas sp.]